jgi:hypothetical protein
LVSLVKVVVVVAPFVDEREVLPLVIFLKFSVHTRDLSSEGTDGR